MTRPIRWLVILGLLALIYWRYAVIVDATPAPQKAPDDWREGAGLLVVFVSIVAYFVASYVGAAKRNRPIADQDPTATLVFAASTRQAAFMSVPAIGAAIGSWLLFTAQLTSPISLILAYAGAALAVLAAFLIFVHVTCGPFRLSLSKEGLDYGVFQCGPIAWHDIRNVGVRKYLSGEVISLEIKDPEKYFARGFRRGGRIMRQFANGLSLTSPFVISAQQVQSTTETVLRAINARLAAFGSDPTVKETI